MILRSFKWQLLMMFVPFILLPSGFCYNQKNSLQLPGGRRAPCNNEGESVAVDDIDKKGCFSCICKNGFVECRSEYTCPPIDGCYMIMEGTEDGCCQRCKGCLYKGIQYLSHTEWNDPNDPCKIMRCEAGIVTESTLQCHTPCLNPLPPGPGMCCPTCSECKINGQVATDDRDVTSDDPCLKCRCVDGRLSCTKTACPVLQCSEEHQVKIPGECCLKCIGTRSLLSISRACTVGNSFYFEGHKFNTDRCTHCTCINGTAICRRNSCPVLNCASEFQDEKTGNCCPVCEMPSEYLDVQCSYMGKVYENGKSWKLDSCSSCKCVQGRPSCARTRCNTTLACPPGSKYVELDGECCGRCIENDGVCMAFGNSHYKSFDGKIYTFGGLGKYQMVSDCRTHTFSVRITNVQKKSLNARRVSIKANNVRINLGQNFRCKVNGQLVNFPFKIEGTVKIEKRNDMLQLTILNKILVIWNGKSFLEVTVPPEYKNKLCGLCGNFNSIIKDDFKLRRGIVVKDTDVAAFGSSWCVGSKQSCLKQTIQIAKIRPCKMKNFVRNHCKYLLNTEVFNGCDSKLNYNKYYNACKLDMCNCPSGKCYCESLTAYSRECNRLGVDVDNWKKDSFCLNTNKIKRKKHGSLISQEDIDRILKGIRTQNRTKSGRSPIPLN